MTEEQMIQTTLTARFPDLQGAVRVQRRRRVWVEARLASLPGVLEYAVEGLGFSILCAITGLDRGASLGVIYHLASETGVMLNVAASIPKEAPLLPTITGRFPAADIYERELADLLGVRVQGLPEGTRYPLPDDWPTGEFPLRKDWRPDSLRALRPQQEAQDA
jgi:Ni,Fe-hydrogenase III component G